jgi:hypothetical protein
MAQKEVVNVLKEWTVKYLKHRDIMLRTIVKIDEKPESLAVEFKDKDQFFLIRTVLDEDVINEINDKQISIITLNSKENFDFLIDKWKKLVKFQDLTLFFVNPFSELEEKWFISPYVHNKICDDDSLKQGLKSMFDTVEETNENEVIKRKKASY